MFLWQSDLQFDCFCHVRDDGIVPVGASVTDIQRHAGHPDRYASQGSNKVGLPSSVTHSVVFTQFWA